MDQRELIQRMKDYETKEELIEILKNLAYVENGVKHWNNFRKANPGMEIKLINVDLQGINLGSGDLPLPNLIDANFQKEDYFRSMLPYILENAESGVNLDGAQIVSANLEGANLQKVSLENAYIENSSLVGAKVNRVNFFHAYIAGSDFENAVLTGSPMLCAFLDSNNLKEADFTEVMIGKTVFANIDLSETKGLGKVETNGPSHITTSTLKRSKGNIPTEFLHKCGFSDWEIELTKLYQPGLSLKERTDILQRSYDLRAKQAG